MQQNQSRGSGGEARSSAACPYCRRTFRRTEHLTRHVRIHTKEKPFVCQCGAAFARRDLLTRHERATNHGHSPNMLVQEPPEATTVPQPTEQAGQKRSNENPVEIFSAGNHQASHLHPLVPFSYQDVDLSPEFVHNETELNTNDQFREFGNFLDGLGGLSAEWISYFHGRDLTYNIPDPQFSQIWQVSQSTANVRESGSASNTTSPVDERLGTPVGSWLPTAPRQARIVEDFREDGTSSTAPATGRISDEQHAQLAYNLEAFRNVIGPTFRLPSQHALTRYVTSCFEGFIRNLPFIHHTWRVVETAMELLLAICAIGARYCFEHRTSLQLYIAAKAILVARVQRERNRFGPGTVDSLHLDNSVLDNAAMQQRVRTANSSRLDWGAWEPNDSIPTLILLTGYAAWEHKVSLVQECLKLHGLLAQILRDLGLKEEGDQGLPSTQTGKGNTLTWREWIRRESNRRAKLSAFAFIHTASIAYNVYPILRASEISLRLPCTTREWNALTGAQWHAARQAVSKEQLYLQEAMRLLLTKGSDFIILDPWPTPLGNYILLHGLIQRIHLVRDLLLPTGSQPSLPREDAETMERALHSWASGFQVAPESSLDQQTDHGPIPFICSAMLALAHIRITQNFGPYRNLDSLDPVKIGEALSHSPRVSRHDGIISAVLYATHALSIPVRLGLERVAKSQFFFWTVRHSLSGLECAVILSQWLSSLASTVEAKPLTDAEFHILQWVRRIVHEAYMFVDFDDEDIEFHEDPAFLSVGVVKVWAHFFKKNAQWPFINILGESLDQYHARLQAPRE